MPVDLPQSPRAAPPRPAAPIAACGLVLALLALVTLSRHEPAVRADARPRVDPIVDAGPPGVDSGPTGAQLERLLADRPMDLNRATAGELEVLPRIGPTLAGRIVADRAENGLYGSVADLTRVRGIGPRTLARLSPMITVETPAAP